MAAAAEYQHTIDQFLENPNKETPGSFTFKLSRVFRDFLEEVRAASPQDMVKLQKKYRDLVVFQLESYLYELLRVPLHSDNFFLPTRKDGKLDLFHPLYRRGLIDQIQRAVAELEGVAGDDKVRQERYLSEYKQLLLVLELIENNILPPAFANAALDAMATPEVPSGFTPYSGALPKDLLDLIPEDHKKEVYLGPLYLASYAPNSVTYPRGDSFINLYEVLYIPSLPAASQYAVICHQYLDNFSLRMHTHMLGLHKKASEAEILGTVLPIRDELEANHIDLQKPEEIFQYIIREHQGFTLQLPFFYLKQQRHVGEAFEYKQRIEAMADTAIEAFMRELESLSPQTNFSIDEMSMLMIKTLGLNGKWDKKLVEQQYESSFMHPRQTQAFAQEDAHTKFLQSLVTGGMTHAGLRFVSVLDCGAGTITGLGRIGNVLNNPAAFGLSGDFTMVDFSRAIEHRSMNRQDQITFIGEDRWKQHWHEGTCRMCHTHYDYIHDTGVGECDVCFYCEAADSLKNKNDKNRKIPQKDEHSEEEIYGPSSVTEWFMMAPRWTFASKETPQHAVQLPYGSSQYLN